MPALPPRPVRLEGREIERPMVFVYRHRGVPWSMGMAYTAEGNVVVAFRQGDIMPLVHETAFKNE